MPRQHIIIFKSLSAAVAVVVAVALTVSLVNRVYSLPQRPEATPYDGVTLYRALFFASGPVANRIPTIVRVGPYLPSEYKDLEGQLIEYIRGKDQNFFDRFAREIQSGDRVRVLAAIKSANALQKESVIAVTSNSRTRFASEVRRERAAAAEPSPQPSPGVITDLASCAIIVAIVHVLTGPSVPSELKGLSVERYIDEIVRAVPKMPQSAFHPET